MKIYKITTKQTGKDGKNYWPEIGTIFMQDDGKMSGFLNNSPNQKIYLFEKKLESQQGQQQPKQQYNNSSIQFAKEEFNAEELPF